MKIVNNIDDTRKKFEELHSGDVFIDNEGDYCMKMDRISLASIDKYNAVTLHDGTPFVVSVSEIVTPVSAELRILDIISREEKGDKNE